MRKRGGRGLRRKKKTSEAHFSLVGYFLQEMYPLMIQLEQEGRIAIDYRLPGVVLNYEMGSLYTSCITEHILQLRKRLGSINKVVNAFEKIPGFYDKHNPYIELLTFIQWCKMLCAMRAGYEAGEKGIQLEYNPDARFFITIMKEDLSEPSHIGFEWNGQIKLELYTTEAEEVKEGPEDTTPHQ